MKKLFLVILFLSRLSLFAQVEVELVKANSHFFEFNVYNHSPVKDSIFSMYPFVACDDLKCKKTYTYNSRIHSNNEVLSIYFNDTLFYDVKSNGLFTKNDNLRIKGHTNYGKEYIYPRVKRKFRIYFRKKQEYSKLKFYYTTGKGEDKELVFDVD